PIWFRHFADLSWRPLAADRRAPGRAEADLFEIGGGRTAGAGTATPRLARRGLRSDLGDRLSGDRTGIDRRLGKNRCGPRRCPPNPFDAGRRRPLVVLPAPRRDGGFCAVRGRRPQLRLAAPQSVDLVPTLRVGTRVPTLRVVAVGSTLPALMMESDSAKRM